MMDYLIEMDIIPLCVNQLRYPVTRRHRVVAESISAALLFVDKEYAPGQDCIAIRIIEIGKNS